MKKSKDTIRNRTCDLPACSAVPQTIAPPRALLIFSNVLNLSIYILQQYDSSKGLASAGFGVGVAVEVVVYG